MLVAVIVSGGVSCLKGLLKKADHRGTHDHTPPISSEGREPLRLGSERDPSDVAAARFTGCGKVMVMYDSCKRRQQTFERPLGLA